ncbi:hypothetical protein Ahy_B10g103505 [Arachis hypogaea]|uniref:Aminotransferase-like plant mobile domain-containing protein n=1 Tax=Arachis hypogaea TaxID=3818 RepID=A0A444X3T3_ARAHY|nr:hypothetical protein Ahy_B10g103505 [Arachis hypogaea]
MLSLFLLLGLVLLLLFGVLVLDVGVGWCWYWLVFVGDGVGGGCGGGVGVGGGGGGGGDILPYLRSRLLLSRRVSHKLSPPDSIIPYLREIVFGNMLPLRDFVFDNSLITAFVECWHPETHTFHLPWSESTITLTGRRIPPRCALMESPWVVAFVTFTHGTGPGPWS